MIDDRSRSYSEFRIIFIDFDGLSNIFWFIERLLHCLNNRLNGLIDVREYRYKI
jgi:hypothetical protein